MARLARSEDVDRLLGPQELAAYLGIPVATVYGWRYRGSGPPGMRIGRHLRYRWSDLQTWLTAQTTTGMHQ
jgi:excisionase family DNA binding protein